MASNGATSFVFFIYGDIQWGSGAQIGFNAGDGIRSFMVPGARTSTTLNMETMSNVGIPGVFIYRVSGVQIEGIEIIGRLIIIVLYSQAWPSHTAKCMYTKRAE